MSTIESLLGKSLHEVSNEELAEFAKSKRTTMTAILEDDIGSALGSTKGSARKARSAADLAELEDAL